MDWYLANSRGGNIARIALSAGEFGTPAGLFSHLSICVARRILKEQVERGGVTLRRHPAIASSSNRGYSSFTAVWKKAGLVRVPPIHRLAIASLFLLFQEVKGDTFNITDGDVNALKAAITAANSNGEDDTIELATNGTYDLTEVDHGSFALPNLGADGGRRLIIHANAATMQCSPADGTSTFGVFEVGAGANVSISAVTVKHASATASSCATGGTLNVQDCFFEQNTGEDSGAIANSGSLSVSNTTFSGNSGVYGGGVGNWGIASVTRCTFTGNVAADGGAIYCFAAGADNTLVVRNCSFTLNSTPTDIGGGAIYIEAVHANASVDLESSTFDRNSAGDSFTGHGLGGALCVLSDNFSTVNTALTNCTLVGNSARNGGAIFDRSHGDGDAFSYIRMINCTLTGNSAFTGGALYDDSSTDAFLLTIGNTILRAGSSGGTLMAATSSLGHNLCSDNAGGVLSGPGDQINTDPKLDPNGLQNNGGQTQTIALLGDSPAVDAADGGFAPHRDQRGYFRSRTCDAGALEYQGGLVGASSISCGANDITVRAEIVRGKTYRLERKASLTDTSWQSIPGVTDLTAVSDDVESITDPGAISLQRAFYHVRVVP
jgi:predicted outer membrane repeat protein